MRLGFALFAVAAPEILRASARGAGGRGDRSFWVHHRGAPGGLAAPALGGGGSGGGGGGGAATAAALRVRPRRPRGGRGGPAAGGGGPVRGDPRVRGPLRAHGGEAGGDGDRGIERGRARGRARELAGSGRRDRAPRHHRHGHGRREPGSAPGGTASRGRRAPMTARPAAALALLLTERN